MTFGFPNSKKNSFRGNTVINILLLEIIIIFILQLESYMDDAFLQTALSKMGENQLVSIKVMKNKFTGEPASYGFINFNSDHHALMAMHRLNGKVIPDSTPVSYLKKVMIGFSFSEYARTSEVNGRNSSKWTRSLVVLAKIFKIMKNSRQSFLKILSNG